MAMTLGIDLSIKGTIRRQDGPPSPVAPLNFAGETYSINGVSKTLAECLTGFNHSSIVPGEGWVLQGTASASDFVLSTPELFAAVSASNTAVFDVSVVVGAGSNLSFNALVDDGASSNFGAGTDKWGGHDGIYIVDQDAPSPTVRTALQAPLATGDYHIVQSLDPAGSVFCLNHGPVVPYAPINPAKFAAYTQFFNYIWVNGVDGAKITVRRLDYYALVTDPAIIQTL
jgi:hypothetical protein